MTPQTNTTLLEESLEALEACFKSLRDEYPGHLELFQSWCAGRYGDEYISLGSGQALPYYIVEQQNPSDPDGQAQRVLGGHDLFTGQEIPVIRRRTYQAEEALAEVDTIGEKVRQLVEIDIDQGTQAPRSLGKALLGWVEVRDRLSEVSSALTKRSDGWSSSSADIYKARCEEQEAAIGIAIQAVEKIQDLLAEKLVNLAGEFQSLNEAVSPVVPSFSDAAGVIEKLLSPWKWTETLKLVTAALDAAIETTRNVTEALTAIVSNTLDMAVDIKQAEAAMNDRFGGHWPEAGVQYPHDQTVVDPNQRNGPI